MMDITLSILALIAGGVILDLFTTARAPMSHQEEKGFGLGTDAETLATDFPAGNPS